MATQIHTGFTSAWGFRCSAPKTKEAEQCRQVIDDLSLDPGLKYRILGYIPFIGIVVAWATTSRITKKIDRSSNEDGKNNIYYGLTTRNVIAVIPVLGGLINLIGDLAMSAIRSLPCVDGGGAPESRGGYGTL